MLDLTGAEPAWGPNEDTQCGFYFCFVLLNLCVLNGATKQKFKMRHSDGLSCETGVLCSTKETDLLALAGISS
ncbi:hypothetical protein AMECASPLE_020625 [Ameca splendens]|uniref:Uncharacterized protein n=1 Tax=Ameca splendens TaxID=208324 RepID=A0ABV1A203_9TELE